MNNQTRIMKSTKLFLSLCLLAFTFFTQNTNAQTTLGGGLAYGSEIENIGIDLTGQYFIKDNLAIEAAFVYYFPKDFGDGLSSVDGEDYKIKWYEINANVNYYFNMTGNIKAYGLGGLNMSIVSVPTFNLGSIFGGGAGVKNESTSKIGLNIGGGADFDLGKNFTPFAQIKYVLSDFDQLQILGGVRFNL